MRDRTRLAQGQIEAMNSGDYTLAFELAKHSGASPAVTDAFTFNSSGILIDCGSMFGDEASINLGMTLAQAFIDDSKATPEYQARARYNVSNGYAALALQCERNSNELGCRENWEKQRDELQVLVLEPESIPSDLKSEILTNFGNVLDELG